MRSVIAGSLQFLADIIPWVPRRSTGSPSALGHSLNVFEIPESTLDHSCVGASRSKQPKILFWVRSLDAMRLPTYAIALIFLTLPNLPLVVSAGWLGVWPHGYINIEFLLIGALGLFLPRGFVYALLVVELVADYAYVICYAYQFSLENLFSSLRYLSVLPRGRVVEGLSFVPVVLIVCAVLALIRPLPQARLRAASGLLAVIACLIPLDMLSGQNPLWHKGDVALFPFRTAREPIMSLVAREFRNYRMNEAWRNAKNVPVPSASAGAVSFVEHRASTEEAPDVVVVLVESWGLPFDRQLAQALTAPYDDPRVSQKFHISYGSVPFTGLTLPGEARELCHSTLGFGILRASGETARQCMPARFHARGYETIALHGYVGQMYNRNALYPNLGFDQALFGPDLRKIGLPDCRGAFPGICDTSIADWIGTSLLDQKQEKPRFIYWVTLNSHLPIPANPDLPDDGVCATQPALQNSAALCSWFRLIRAVHQSVQQIALGPTARPTVFLLVGDHAPPFGESQLHEMFSKTDVPYVLLTPAVDFQR